MPADRRTSRVGTTIRGEEPSEQYPASRTTQRHPADADLPRSSIIVFAIFTSVWTDRLWYRSFDFGSVFSTMLLTRIGLFLSFGLIMATIVGANAVIAYRMRPRVRPALLAAPCSSVTGRCSNPSSSG